MYELRDIPANHPDGRSCRNDPYGPKEGRGYTGERYTAAIYDGDRWVFRFHPEGLRPTANGKSFAGLLLEQLSFLREEKLA